MRESQNQVDSNTLKDLTELWGPAVIADIYNVRPLDSPSGKIGWYGANPYTGCDYDDDDPNFNLSDNKAKRHATQVVGTGAGGSITIFGHCSSNCGEETHSYVDPGSFSLRQKVRTRHQCGRPDSPWVSKDYIMPIEVTRTPETGIADMQGIEVELPCISEIYDDAEDLADANNADAIVFALSKLDEPSIASDVRRAILRDMPATCAYMVTRRKMKKREKELQKANERLADLEDELEATWYHGGRRHFEGVVSFLRHKISRYNRRLYGSLGQGAELEPCNVCFSCKDNTIGSDVFLEKEIPCRVNETVNHMKGEMLNLI